MQAQHQYNTACGEADRTERHTEAGGYGLGLSIAHAIVENHGGTISVRSGENEGTTFEVQL